MPPDPLPAPDGVGLGLAVARGFTEVMGGTLTAEDTPGGGLTVVVALPASAATICEQFGTVDAGPYVIMNNRWGTSATQCINVTSTGFQLTQADGSNATNGAPKSYPSVYLGCHFANCSPGSPLPMQISQIGTATTSATASTAPLGRTSAAATATSPAASSCSSSTNTNAHTDAARKIADG